MEYIVAVTDLGTIGIIIRKDHLGDLVHLLNGFGDIASIAEADSFTPEGCETLIVTLANRAALRTFLHTVNRELHERSVTQYIRARLQQNEVARRLRQQQLSIKLNASVPCVNPDETGRRINVCVVKGTSYEQLVRTAQRYGTVEYVVFCNAARSNAVICYNSRQSARLAYAAERNSVLGAIFTPPTPSGEGISIQKKRFRQECKNWVDSRWYSWKSHCDLCTHNTSARFDKSRQLSPLPHNGAPPALEDHRDSASSDEDGSEAAIPSCYRRRNKLAVTQSDTMCASAVIL